MKRMVPPSEPAPNSVPCGPRRTSMRLQVEDQRKQGRRGVADLADLDRRIVNIDSRGRGARARGNTPDGDVVASAKTLVDGQSRGETHDIIECAYALLLELLFP
jgi:hypothetical protein